MRAFKFSLESVYRWRSAQGDVHEARVQRLSSRLEECLAKVAEIEGRQIATTRETVSEPVLSAAMLSAAAAHRSRLGREASAARTDSEKTTLDLDRERKAWIEVRRALRALGKLRTRQRAEYLRESDREIEAFAAESFISQWQQRKRSMTGECERVIEKSARANRDPDSRS